MTSPVPLLEVRDLRKSYALRQPLAERLAGRTPSHVHPALDGVSLTLERGTTLGLVGESGCGKTTLSRCILRLVAPDAGSITFDGVDVLAARGGEVTGLRRRVQMVFQDPYSSLNPRLTVGEAVAEPARVHGLVDRRGEEAYVAKLLDQVGLSARSAERRPRELSGGQRQRVAIARALALQPELLIADEPVSALDVSVQAQILNLLDDLRRDLGLTMLFVAHQLSVVRHVADRVAVMYFGRVVEEGPVGRVFGAPQHPYTAALLDAAPRLGRDRARPAAVRGELPPAGAVLAGCAFRGRCTFAQQRCAEVEPPLASIPAGGAAACHVLPFDGQRG